MELWGYEIDIPTALLLVMFALIGFVLWSARLGPRWGEALSDDGGKVSALRLAVFVALAVSSWQLIYVTITVVHRPDDVAAVYSTLATYVCVWSGAKVAEKALDAILAKFGVGRPQ